MTSIHEQYKKKGGRPPTGRVRKLSKSVTVKFSKPSYEALRLRARKANRKLAEYIRESALNGEVVSGHNTETIAIAKNLIGMAKLEQAILAMAVKEGESIDKLARLREAICIFTDLTKKEASNGEQRSKLLFDAINQVKQELNATSKNVQEKLHAMGNTPQKKIVTHRFEPTSKYVLLFIGGLALSLVISIWGNFTQWREYQDWEEADLKYRALKMVLPSDDPNVRYIEKFFSVCRDEKVIDDVKNRVAAYEDSVYHHYKMVKMAAIKDSIANSLFKEANEIKKKINKK